MNLRHLVPALLVMSCVRLTAADEFAAGEVLIRFKDSAPLQEVVAFEKTESLTFVNEVRTIKVRLYRLPQGADVKAAVARFSHNPVVDFAEPNYARDLSAVNDPFYPLQWSLHNTGQRVNGVSGTTGIDIRWPEAMALFKGVTPITVAVIDSGVALDHPEIFANVFTNAAELTGFTGVDDDRNGYIDDFSGYDFYAQDPYALDEFGHGTLVASIIAGVSNNNLGGVGISPTARIMSLRVLNQFGRGGVPKFARVSDVALALDYAQKNGARVVNLSLGGSAFSSTELLILQALSSAGVLVVAAAGNGGDDGMGDNNDVTPVYPASYAVNNIIAVAAQDRSGGLGSFSNYGVQRVHIAAPGTQILGADVTRRTVFSQNFNGATPGWTTGSSTGNLSSNSWSIFTAPDSFLVDRLTGSTYSPFTNTWVRTPLISLVGVLGARLTFDSFFDLADDVLFIEASVDGVNWFPYSYLVGTSDSNVGTYSVDISDFDGGFGYFRFRLSSNAFFQGIGVAIDNVTISSVTVFDPGTPRFQYLDGTSFAAPMVSGVAALVMSQRPDLTASQVRSIILNSARPVSALSGKISTGGMLDAERALQLANSAPATGVPSITAQPTGQSVAAGVSVTFTVSANGTAPFTYQWRKDGVAILGATNATLTLSNVQSTAAGNYTVVVTNSTGSVVSNAAALNVTIPNPGRLINLSILTTVTSNAPVFTVGTVVGGAGTSGTKPLLIRAAGPSLTALGVTGALADPKLDLFSGQTVVATNDNWGGTATLTNAFASVGAFAYTSAASRDAAAYNPTLAAGNYTVQVSGVGGATGTVIAEIYDATPASAFTLTTPRLINVSVLKQVGDSEILTAGFVIGGATSKQVLIRAIGPTLGSSPFNVPGVMVDPRLDLFSGQTVINSNDNWGGGAALASAFASVGAFALPAASKDAALLVTLPPGNYTAQVRALSGGLFFGFGGVVLVEVYEVP